MGTVQSRQLGHAYVWVQLRVNWVASHVFAFLLAYYTLADFPNNWDTPHSDTEWDLLIHSGIC